MKCLGTIRSIVCITATFMQQIVGQIILGRVVFGTSLACYFQSYHAKIFWTGLQSRFSAKVRFWCKLIYTCPIILKLNRNDPLPKGLGSIHHRNLSRPKSRGRNDPDSVICTATMLLSFGLVYCPILRLKNVFFGADLRKIGSSPYSIKNLNKAITLRNRTHLGIRKMLCVHDMHISKNNWVFNI